MRDGMPKPSATIESSSSSWTAASRPASTAACDSVGVLVSRRRPTVPSRATTPATATLNHDSGSLLTNSTTILMLGTDHMNNDQRVNDFHSDSIMLLRTDPGKHRLAYLSIPRDLRVAVPGHGDEKVNAAMQIGG